MSLEKPLRGIVVPMITPLKDQNTLDTEGLERLVEHILSGGVHGLFILGTTGEGSGLSYDLRYELVEQVCDQVEGRVPVLVGISDTALSESLRLAKKAADCGADAVVATPPYYFRNSQDELKEYFYTLAGQSDLPLFLYNIPALVKERFDPETVKELANHPNIAGFKDSSSDLIYFQKVIRLLKDVPGFTLLVGPEEILMQAMLSGGHGGVNGGANMFPKLYVSMYDSVVARDFERMEALQKQILQISSGIYTIGNSPASYLQGVKAALSIMGICDDAMAVPNRAFNERQKEVAVKILKDLNVL